MATPRPERPTMPGYGLASAEEGSFLPWSWAEERLAGCRNYWLSTVRTDGRPHAMPVWGVWLEDAFWFNTGAQSRKTRNLAANAQCVVATEGADECAILEGEAVPLRLPDEQAAFDRFVAVYEKKYGWSLAESKDPTFVVRPVVAFGFIEAAEQFLKTATRWRF